MGRDVTGIRSNTKPTRVELIPDRSVSQETARVSPKISGLSVKEEDHECNSVTNNSTVEENKNKPDVVGSEKTDPTDDSPRVKKSDVPVKGNGKADDAVLQPQANDNETFASNGTPRAGERTDSIEKNSNNSKNIDMPTNAKDLQPTSPKGTRKSTQSDRKTQLDEEDNFSAASSAAASAKASRFKTTVPVAPVFTCVARLEKCKQFYSKLEEKQAAMEAERSENEARIKEKEQESLRQLRKNLVFKANPVPSFYREGPPPKPKLKKIPVTRAKSPKLNRRKSCSDVTNRSYSEEKGKERQHNAHSHRSRRHTNNGEAIAEKSTDSSETVLEDTNNPAP